MFTLLTKKGREAVLDRNGEPFKYSSKALADIGKRVIQEDRKIDVVVVKL